MNGVGLVFTGQGFNEENLLDFTSSEYHSLIEFVFFEVFSVSLPALDDMSSIDVKRNEISAVILLLSSLGHIKKTSYSADSVSVVAGYSVGQYLAMYFAGMFDLESLVRLVLVRCKLMNKAAKNQGAGMMAVLGLPLARISELLIEEGVSDSVYIANDNAAGNVSLSGLVTDLQYLEPVFLKSGAYKIVDLKTTGAWHSPFMSSISAEFLTCLNSISFCSPRCAVIDNSSLSVMSGENSEIKQLLLNHLVSPVRWRESVKMFSDYKVSKVYEVSDFDLLTRVGPYISREIQFSSLGGC